MDSIHPNNSQDRHDSQIHTVPGFVYDNPQHDAFGSMFQIDHDQSFQSPWTSAPINDPSSQPDAYRQAPHSWHQTAFRPSSTLQQQNYGLESRGFSNAFNGNVPAYDYSAFGTQPSHPFSAPAYDPALPFSQDSLVNSSGFDPSRQQSYVNPTETISPQALQAYSNSFGQTSQTNELQSQLPRSSSTVSAQGVAASQQVVQAPSRRDSAKAIVDALPRGSIQGKYLVKRAAELVDATNSTLIKGFVFVGNSEVDVKTTKATVPKFNRRRSKNEVRRLLLKEKGDGPWSAAREPLLKKLKISGKSTRPRAASSNAQRTITSAAHDSASDFSSSSDSKEDSDYYSASEEESEEQEPTLLASTRPLDPAKAVDYDILNTVWAKRSSILTGPTIRTALGDYWNIVKGVRDKWKQETTDLQQAEFRKDQAKMSDGRNRVAEQRQIMESAIDLTLKYGHRDIIEKLGENTLLLIVFYQLLADRFKDGDYNGTIVVKILQLMTRCVSLDSTILEKTKLDKVLSRLVKREDGSIKAIAQRVLENAAATTKQKTNDAKAAQALALKQKTSQTIVQPTGRAADGATVIKRSRDGEQPAAQSLKKPSTGVAAASSPTSLTKVTGLSSKRASSSTKAEPKTGSAAPASNTTAPKPKVNHVVSKPSGFFSSLQSASKKPGTSIAALQSAQLKDAKNSSLPDGQRQASTAVPNSAPKPVFSFAETMANLTKPKESTPAAKTEERRASETEEELKTRLRKEERRKLRVSFKPDDTLVQIRVFVHEPEEDTGHDDSMMRDVDDIGQEGRMLKMHKELEVMDDEEENVFGEESLAPWRHPSLVDFSVIQDVELARNCTTRGGRVEVKSHERAVQEQRELTTLMVIYTALSDIPSSPREPVDPFSGDYLEECAFGTPQEETRSRAAFWFAQQNSQSSGINPIPSSGQPGVPDLSSVLQLLNRGQQQPLMQQQPSTQSEPNIPAPVSGLEAIFARFSGNQAGPPQVQAQIPPAPGFDLQALLASTAQQNQAQQEYVPPPAGQVPDLSAILAQFGQPANSQPYTYQNQDQNQNQTENDRKRTLDYDGQGSEEFDYGYNKGKRQKNVKEKDKKYIPRVPCRFWQEGKCKKGDDCNFLHV